MAEVQTRAARGRRAAVLVTAVAAAGLTVGSSAVVMPAANAQADTFLGVDSPTITAANGKKRIVHFGTLGYGDANTLALDARIASPDSLWTKDAQSVEKLRVAYVIDRYIDTPNRYRAAALSWYVRKRAPDSHLADATKAMKAMKAKDGAHYRKIASQYSIIRAAADKWVGPYTVRPEVSSVTDGEGTVDQIGVKAASGAWIDGKKVTVKLSGPATFPDGSTTKSATTKRKPMSWTWKSTGDGRVSATVTVSKLKATTFRVYHPAKKGQQRLAVAGPSEVVTVKANEPRRMATGSPSTPPPTTPSTPPRAPSTPPASTPPTSPSSPPTPSSPAPSSGTAQNAAFSTGDRSAKSSAGALAAALGRAASAHETKVIG